MKRISVILPCYNEEDNIRELYRQLKEHTSKLNNYEFDFIFIDNYSQDSTREQLRRLAAQDVSVKVIFNARNFGHIRSPYHGMLQSTADATILMATDLQDPPELISKLVEKWESGHKIVAAVKTTSEESKVFFNLRKLYYIILDNLSNVKQIRNFTGFGLYDRVVMDELKKLKEPYPYFRGLIAEIGFEICRVDFRQPSRTRGITKNNFASLYDMAVLGLVSYSRAPLRIATIVGFITALLSITTAFAYFLYKLIYWDSFQVGIAPLVIGLFFISSIQLFFLGVLGEYVGVIFTQTKDRPLVVEESRLNF